MAVTRTGKKIGRPRIHASDADRKRAHAERKQVAKRGADIVERTPDTSAEHPLTVRAKVIEETAPLLDVPAPVHPSGSDVPEAGTEGGSSSPATVGATASKEAEAFVLDPAVVVSLTKGVFALIALRGGEHWNVTEEEIEPIAEPMCRQLARIPAVAMLGQNGADLILIGSVFGGLIFARAQQSVETRKLEQERRTLGPVRRGVDGSGKVVELRPEPGETARVAEASAGDRYQEVREPDEPRINLNPFRASG